MLTKGYEFGKEGLRLRTLSHKIYFIILGSLLVILGSRREDIELIKVTNHRQGLLTATSVYLLLLHSL